MGRTALDSPHRAWAVTVTALWNLTRHRHEMRERQRRRDALPEVVELLAIHLAAGDRPAAAVAHLDGCVPDEFAVLVTDTTRALAQGLRLDEAMEPWRHDLGSDVAGIVDVITMADRDGGPLGPVLTQLMSEIRAQRRRDREAEARRLPVRLAGPLVICILPSFILLGLVPLIAAALASLTATDL